MSTIDDFPLFQLQHLNKPVQQFFVKMSKTETTIALTQTQQPQQSLVQKPRSQQTLILKLQAKQRPRVSWTEDTIDNEHMNKKKSNLCCIYHRPGESSSDTCTSDDEGNALERDRHTKHLHKKKCSKYAKKQQKGEEKKCTKNSSCGNKC